MTEGAKTETLDPTPLDIAQSLGYMEAVVDIYLEAGLICKNMVDTMPATLRLTQDGQANLSLLKSMQQAFIAKSQDAGGKLQAALKLAKQQVETKQ